MDWFAALSAGAIEHSWSPLVVEANGHRAELRVSADACRVGGVRHRISAREQQLLADAMGCLLLTSKLYDERWRQATVRIPPQPGDVVRRTDEQHSEAVDRAIQIADGRTGPWLVADPGKTWLLDARCTAARAVNYGWHTGPEATWRGIKTLAPATGADRVLQSVGGAHDLGHSDYSQVALYVDDTCLLDGHACPTARLYTEAEYAPLVTADGKPLPWSRHPGVDAVDPQQGVA